MTEYYSYIVWQNEINYMCLHRHVHLIYVHERTNIFLKTFTVRDKNNVITDDDNNDASVKKFCLLSTKTYGGRFLPPGTNNQRCQNNFQIIESLSQVWSLPCHSLNQSLSVFFTNQIETGTRFVLVVTWICQSCNIKFHHVGEGCSCWRKFFFLQEF